LWFPVVKNNDMGAAEPETRALVQINLFHGAVISENQMPLHRVTQRTQLTSRVTSCEESVMLLYDP
jgi:hypothetical protein